MIFVGIFVGVVTAVAWFARLCAFRVEEGQVAVLTSFGGALRDGGQLVTFGPGLHPKRPWHRAHVVSLREQALDLSGAAGQRVMAEDGTVLRLEASVRYVPTAEGLEAFLFGLARAKEHVHGLFTCLVRSEIANLGRPAESDSGTLELDVAAGAYGFIRRERQLLNRRLAATSAALGETYGVRFSAVDMTDILPPDELAEALNAVMNARSEAETLRFKADSDCHRQLMAAQEGVAIARTQAAAVERELTTLATHLKTLDEQGTLDLYVERRRHEVLGESRTLYFAPKEVGHDVA